MTKFKVLYVEDEEDDVLFMKRALGSLGADVDLAVARDGEQAILTLSDPGRAFDWLLLDLKMPRRSGLDVLEWIRKDSNVKELKVTILSSSPEPSDIARATALGVDGYIVKPVNFNGLRAIAQDLCLRWGVRLPPTA